MEPDAEQTKKRRRRRIKGGGGGIPEDVLDLILNQLPLKSLARFKAVSKSWDRLIRSRHPFFLGLFYSIYCASFRCPRSVDYNHPSGKGIFRYMPDSATTVLIDPSLSFLPDSAKTVLDCCNGLLLLCQDHIPNTKYYICNPLTKSWTQLPRGLNWQFSRIDFNPNVSPYFKIVTFHRQRQESVLRIKVLSSETPTMSWKQYQPVKFRDPSVHEYYTMMFRYQHHALWEGSLYLLFGTETVIFGDAGRIMRFDLLEEEEDHVAIRHLIELPKGTKKPKSVGIGRSRNKLCLAGLDWIIDNDNSNQRVLRLRVWSLSNRYQTVWVMEHDSIITPSSHLLCPPSAYNLWEKSAYVGHFHPFLDAVFIHFKNIVYAYDLKNLSLNEVCHIGSYKREVLRASIFPFLPSLVDYSIQWKTTNRRRETSHGKGMRRLTSAVRRRL